MAVPQWNIGESVSFVSKKNERKEKKIGEPAIIGTRPENLVEELVLRVSSTFAFHKVLYSSSSIHGPVLEEVGVTNGNRWRCR